MPALERAAELVELVVEVPHESRFLRCRKRFPRRLCGHGEGYSRRGLDGRRREESCGGIETETSRRRRLFSRSVRSDACTLFD